MAMANNVLFGQVESASVPFSNFAETEISWPIELADYESNVNKFAAKNAFEHYLQIDFKDMAQLSTVEGVNSTLYIYQLKIKAPNAGKIQLNFSNLHLENGVTCFLIDANNPNFYLGGFTHINNNGNGLFSIRPFETNQVILEVNSMSPLDESTVIELESFYNFFPTAKVSTNNVGFEESLSCQTNVRFQPYYDKWCNEIRSVVKIARPPDNTAVELDTFSSCSGVLVKHIDGDNYRPIILTAAHCIRDLSEIQRSRTVVYFNFQSPTCDPNQRGNERMTTTGISQRALNDVDECPDLAIIELNEPIAPLQYNPYYSGWDFGENDDKTVTLIHHPKDDLKKITDAKTSKGIFRKWKGCLTVDDFTDGIPEKGSSGAGYFEHEHGRVFGLVRGRLDDNPDPESCDYDLKMAISLLEDSKGYIRPVLANNDPDIGGNYGSDPISACIDEIDLNGIFYPGNDWQQKNQIEIQASNSIQIGSNGLETAISDSRPAIHPNLNNNSDYIIRAGNNITLLPGVRINAPDRDPMTGVYLGTFEYGNENRASFQIAPCIPFETECGFNHSAKTIPYDNTTPVEINIYPNPSIGMVTIDMSNAGFNKNYNLHVVDVMGKQVMNTSFEVNWKYEDQINIAHLANGLYIFNFTNETGELVKRIKHVKQ